MMFNASSIFKFELDQIKLSVFMYCVLIFIKYSRLDVYSAEFKATCIHCNHEQYLVINSLWNAQHKYFQQAYYICG